jgi:hypothetical protein
LSMCFYGGSQPYSEEKLWKKTLNNYSEFFSEKKLWLFFEHVFSEFIIKRILNFPQLSSPKYGLVCLHVPVAPNLIDLDGHLVATKPKETQMFSTFCESTADNVKQYTIGWEKIRRKRILF